MATCPSSNNCVKSRYFPSRYSMLNRLECCLFYYSTEVLYQCKPNDQHRSMAYAVSMVLNPCDTPTNTVYVRDDSRKDESHVNFTVCLTTLLGNDREAQIQLIEMIEVNRIFGAQRFVFYNISTKPGSTFGDAVEYYGRNDILSVVQWHWPYTHSSRSIYNGQQGARMDCLLRNLYTSKYITFLDIDEFLVPRKTTSWADLLSSAYNTSCGVLFRNSFFYTPQNDDEKFAEDPIVKSSDYGLRTLLKTARSKKIWESGRRSKYIALTRNVKIPSVHVVECYVDKPSDLSVEQGLLHHYRMDYNWDYHTDEFEVDRFMHKFNVTIKDRIEPVLRELRIVQNGVWWRIYASMKGATIGSGDGLLIVRC